MTGSSGIPEFHESPPNVTNAKQPFASSIQIRLQLNAGQSLILHTFATNQFSAFAVRRHTPEAERRRYHYWQTTGQPVEITGPWNVKFILGGPTLPADFQTAQLASWTTFPDTNTQAFAGTAKYETTFDASQRSGDASSPKSGGDAPVAGSTDQHLNQGKTSDEGVAATQLRRGVAATHFEINLGDVRQSARVRVNGKDYGTLITPPFRVVVDNLKPAGNTLEVEVTSVAANRIRDLDRRGVKWKVFRDINIVDINYKPFDASNWPLTDCGLLGPVTLTAVTAK
jgi:hypothetical protein